MNFQNTVTEKIFEVEKGSNLYDRIIQDKEKYKEVRVKPQTKPETQEDK